MQSFKNLLQMEITVRFLHVTISSDYYPVNLTRRVNMSNSIAAPYHSNDNSIMMNPSHQYSNNISNNISNIMKKREVSEGNYDPITNQDDLILDIKLQRNRY